MKNTKLLQVISLCFFVLLIIISPVTAADNEADDLEWRLGLIESSQKLMEEQNQDNNNYHKIGIVFTTYGEDSAVNSGIRFSPVILSLGERPLRFMGEVIYLSKEKDLNAFVSLTFEAISNLYIGGGAEVTDDIDYHGLVGLNIGDNIFLEARIYNSSDNFDNSEEIDVYPFFGLQMSF
ncbi:MAG: hypothetical protein ACQEQP_06005 [Bacillota bacterium]